MAKMERDNKGKVAADLDRCSNLSDCEFDRLHQTQFNSGKNPSVGMDRSPIMGQRLSII
jgi:hypothetical protein